MGPFSSGDLNKALGQLGKSDKTRDEIIESLKTFEVSFNEEGVNAREEITGPVVDALFQENELVSKQLENGLTISCRYKSKITRDFIMAADNPPDHVWEPQTTKVLLALAEEAKTVVVGGAYFGDQAVLIANSIKDKGGVCHCFDVNAEQLGLLEKNASNNNLTNVQRNHVGVWNADNVRLTMVGDDSHAAPQETSDVAEGTFPTVRIETYGDQQGFDSIDLIMLDIEGGELHALEGAGKYLGEVGTPGPAIIFEIHSAYTDWSKGLGQTEIVRFLASKGYSVFAIRDYQSNVPMRGKPVELVPLEGAYIEGPDHGFNMLAVKDEGLLEKHEFRICPDVSPKLLFHRDPKLHQPLS